MSLRQSVNNFVLVLNMSSFMPKKEYLRGTVLHYLIKKNLELKRTEFLLRLTGIIHCQEKHAQIGLDVTKIMIFLSKIKNALVHVKA